MFECCGGGVVVKYVKVVGERRREERRFRRELEREVGRFGMIGCVCGGVCGV